MDLMAGVLGEGGQWIMGGMMTGTHGGMVFTFTTA